MTIGNTKGQPVTTADIPGGGEARRVDSGSEPSQLTPAEDAELRQLAWFAKAGQLSEKSEARLSELRARDRRERIRDPRPDPTGHHVGYASPFGAHAPEPSSTCPNCGSGSLRQVGSSRSCAYCGFSQRHDTDALASVETPAGAPAQSGAEARPLGTVDRDAFRALLLRAANGGVEAADDERTSQQPAGAT